MLACCDAFEPTKKEMIALLFESGINVNAVDAQHSTALVHYCWKSLQDLIKKKKIFKIMKQS